MTIGGILLPETPNSLIERGFQEKGKKVLEKIRGTSNVQEELQDIKDASELANSIKHPFRNILERRNRLQLIMVIFMPTFQILTSINSIIFYAPVLFQSMGFERNASLYSSALTGVVLASSIHIHLHLHGRQIAAWGTADQLRDTDDCVPSDRGDHIGAKIQQTRRSFQRRIRCWCW